MKALSSILYKEEAEISAILKLKCVLITYVNVQRSFLAYKLVLGEKRQKSKSENVENILVTYCAVNYEEKHVTFMYEVVLSPWNSQILCGIFEQQAISLVPKKPAHLYR